MEFEDEPGGWLGAMWKALNTLNAKGLARALEASPRELGRMQRRALDLALVQQAAAGHSWSLAHLLAAGADARSAEGSAALGLAAGSGSAEAVKALMGHADLDAPNELGWRPAHQAIRSKNPAAALALLEAGADFSALGPNGQSCWELAVAGGPWMLGALESAGLRGGDWTAALFEAARLDADDSIAWLLERGADPWARGEFGRTPLMAAAALGNAQACEALAPFSGGVDDEGQNAAMIAARAGNQVALVLAPRCGHLARGPDGLTVAQATREQANLLERQGSGLGRHWRELADRLEEAERPQREARELEIELQKQTRSPAAASKARM